MEFSKCVFREYVFTYPYTAAMWQHAVNVIFKEMFEELQIALRDGAKLFIVWIVVEPWGPKWDWGSVVLDTVEILRKVQFMCWLFCLSILFTYFFKLCLLLPLARWMLVHFHIDFKHFQITAINLGRVQRNLYRKWKQLAFHAYYTGSERTVTYLKSESTPILFYSPLYSSLELKRLEKGSKPYFLIIYYLNSSRVHKYLQFHLGA